MNFDASVPNAARVYDFFLGGKDNYAADRELAQKILTILPDTADVCRDNRAFLQRAVRFLAGEAGVRQFLDIGTGLPTMGSVHQVAQETAPDSRVAYVDYDPVVVAHARALLAQGQDVIAVNGDLRSPEAILADADVRQLIDFSQPVAVLLLAVLHFVTDADRPYEAVRAIVDSLPSGSYLVLTHSTPDDVPDDVTKAIPTAPRGHRGHTGYMGRIIGTILGAILAIWVVVTAASGIIATFKAFLIIGLIAMAVFTVVWLVARRTRRD